MIIVINVEAATFSISEKGETHEYSLHGGEAYQTLSREWMKLGWNLGHWSSFSWMGQRFLQLPDDALRLAELVWRLKPSVIVETGVFEGGSTLWFASLCRLMGHGRVISIEFRLRPEVRKAVEAGAGGLVTLIEGDSAAPETADAIRELIQPGESVLLFLDSDHTKHHVAGELVNLASLVTPGSYLVVADSNLPDLAELPSGEPAWSQDNPGAAVDEFLAVHPEFCRKRPVPQFQGKFDFSELSYFPTTWLKRQ